MSVIVCSSVQMDGKSSCQALDAGTAQPFAPIRFFYQYFHNSVKQELQQLSSSIKQVQSGDAEYQASQQQLRKRCNFLEQVFKCHSYVEDEVIYPALNFKVQNVTDCFSIEHQQEDYLFEQLQWLLEESIHSNDESVKILRQLECKIEEIHKTIEQHLTKEENQLLPLLLEHFSIAEQAEVVAQFLCSIPLAIVDSVLSWVKQGVPLELQHELKNQVEGVVQDPNLKQLLGIWLQPQPANTESSCQFKMQPHLQSLCVVDQGANLAQPSTPPQSSHISSFCQQDDCDTSGQSPTAAHLESPPTPQSAPTRLGTRAPSTLRLIQNVHSLIEAALQNFVASIDTMCSKPYNPSQNLSNLSDLALRFRYIRIVLEYHVNSEEGLLAALVQAQDSGTADVCDLSQNTCMTPATNCTVHSSTALENLRVRRQDQEALDKVGRIMADVRLAARRRVAPDKVLLLLHQLRDQAHCVRNSIVEHMREEEADIIPTLTKYLGATQQRFVVWQTLHTMPLRLLERVMPWLARQMQQDEVTEMRRYIELGAGVSIGALAELLSGWLKRGLAAGKDWQIKDQLDDPIQYTNSTCEPKIVVTQGGLSGNGLEASDQSADDMVCCENANEDLVTQNDVSEATTEAVATFKSHKGAGKRGDHGQTSEDCGSADTGDDAHSKRRRSGGRQYKRRKCHDEDNVHARRPNHNATKPCECNPDGTSVKDTEVGTQGVSGQKLGKPVASGNPIDHIFQFHRALMRDLWQLQSQVVLLEEQTEASGGEFITSDVQYQRQLLCGRFHYFSGMYAAHSKAEDDIIFPALESRKILQNVTQAYTYDHEQEEIMLAKCTKLFQQLQDEERSSQLLKIARELRHDISTARAQLMTHVRAEEVQLWPLFSEHFTHEEQHQLVGEVIGRTGAELFQSLIPWMQSVCTPEEVEQMTTSIREATRNTMFSDWVQALERSGQKLGLVPEENSAGGAEASKHVEGDGKGQARQEGVQQGSSECIAGVCSTSVQCNEQNGIAELAEYLRSKNCDGVSGSSGKAGDVVAHDKRQFYPGWQDMFRMNQKQLTDAMDKLSKDPTLDVSRRAYLMKNMILTKWVAAQQCFADGASAQEGTSTGSKATASVSGQSVKQQRSTKDSSGQTSSSVGGAGSEQLATKTNINGCAHYSRKCRLVAACCNMVTPCKHCHDEQCDYEMNSRDVVEMVCMVCNTRQPIAQTCSACNTVMAKYFCKICNLHDDSREVYHCQYCNVCRLGKGLGVESFHCMHCNTCMSLSLYKQHVCRLNALHDKCPTCLEDLFTSRAPIKELPCGHFMHSTCFAEYIKHSYACPVCRKSIGDMSLYFNFLSQIISREEIPPECAGMTSNIKCNDCNESSQVQFHYVYHACGKCKSYNTQVL